LKSSIKVNALVLILHFSYFNAEEDWDDILKGEIRQELHEFMKNKNDLEGYARQIVNFNKHVQKASHIPVSAKVNAFR